MCICTKDNPCPDCLIEEIQRRKAQTTNKYFLYWMDGNKEIVLGTSIEDAFTKAGYGAGALRALDFYSTEDSHDYDEVVHEWKKRT